VQKCGNGRYSFPSSFQEVFAMTFRLSTLLTAGLLGVLLVAGGLSPVHAGDGSCGKDKKSSGTTSLWAPDLRG
jgi:hypothetical protein